MEIIPILKSKKKLRDFFDVVKVNGNELYRAAGSDYYIITYFCYVSAVDNPVYSDFKQYQSSVWIPDAQITESKAKDGALEVFMENLLAGNRVKKAKDDLEALLHKEYSGRELTVIDIEDCKYKFTYLGEDW